MNEPERMKAEEEKLGDNVVEEEGKVEVEKKRKKIPWKVYLAHILATWGDNLWLFAGGLYMMKLDPSSLRLTASYGLSIAVTIICLGSTLGRWIDRTRRLTAARTCLIVQNTCVALSAAILSAYLSFSLMADAAGDDDSLLLGDVGEATEETEPLLPAWSYYATIVSVIILSAVATLASNGTVIVLQKDWIVVIAGNDTEFLADMNSILRSIELTTRLLAPALLGQLFDFAGYIWTGFFLAAWNVASVVAEYSLLANIYRCYPALHQKIALSSEIMRAEPETRPAAVKEDTDEEGGNLIEDKEAFPAEGGEGGRKVAPKKKNKVGKFFKNSYEGWLVYFRHPVRNAGLGLALLYMTVLGFDNITYAFVLSQGVRESVVGLLVGLAALIGVAGSLAYPAIKRQVGMERTGLLGMFLQVSCSSLSIVSVFLPGSPFMQADGDDQQSGKSLLSAGVLLFGITAARFGLWITDLTVTQVIQERVENERRGVFSGVQSALNKSLDLLKCVLVILLPHPSQFGFLIFLSYTFICSGWILYATYSRRQRGHILPFHSFCRLVHHLGENGKVDGLVHRIDTTTDQEEEDGRNNAKPLQDATVHTRVT